MDLQQLVRQLEERSFPLAWPGHFVDNEWWKPTRGQPLKGSLNPNTGEKLVDVIVDRDAVQKVLDSAHARSADLAALDLQARLDILNRYRQSLADYQRAFELALRIETGKPRWEAQEDFDNAVKYLDWVASHGEEIFAGLLAPAKLGRSDATFALHPIGLTAAYLPFSTPITTFVLYFSASVLAGCPLVLFSSSHAIVNSMLFAGVARSLDLPAGLLNVVFGNFQAFKHAIGEKRVAAILYTGSREHCDTIRKENRTRLGRQAVLQSGGKNAVIVHSSADLDQAVKCVVYGALKTAGQRCTTTSRVFVYRSVLDEFRERIVAAFRAIPIGRTDRLEDDGKAGAFEPFMGPLYSDKAVEKFLRFQTMANRESDETLLWGKTLEVDAKGFFVTPGLHYLENFDNTSAYQSNVLFSPDVAIYPYQVLEEAIAQLNTTDAAFAVSFIGDEQILKDRQHLFLAPNLLVNTPTVEMETTLPLAGRLQSGHHRFHGPGIALYLCYPQALARSAAGEAKLAEWPWPGSAALKTR